MRKGQLKRKQLTQAEIEGYLKSIVNLKDWAKEFVNRFGEYSYYSFLTKYVKFKVRDDGKVEFDIRNPVPVNELPVEYMAVKYEIAGEIPKEVKNTLKKTIDLLVSSDTGFCLKDGVWGEDFLDYKIFFVPAPFENPAWYKDLPFKKLEYVYLNLGLLFDQIFRGINVPQKLSLV